ARGAVEGFLRQFDQLGRVEAGAQPLEAQRGELPVAVAAGAAEQVDLLAEALDEGGAQFGDEREVVAGRGVQRCIERSACLRHSPAVVEERLRRGLSCLALW